MGGEEKHLSLHQKLLETLRRRKTVRNGNARSWSPILLGLIMSGIFGFIIVFVVPESYLGSKRFRLSIYEASLREGPATSDEASQFDLDLDLVDLPVFENSRNSESDDYEEVEIGMDAMLEANTDEISDSDYSEHDETREEEESIEEEEANDEQANEEEDESTFDIEEVYEHFLPFPARITPINPGVLVNYRTTKCTYLCGLALDQGYRLTKASAASPFRSPPEMLMISYKKYPTYASLKNTIVSHVGRGSSCIGGGKGRQLACRQYLADSDGCDFDELGIQPPQWNIQKPVDCKKFFSDAAEKYSSETIWIAKPGGSYHGRGITIHDDLVKMRKKFGNCEKNMLDGIIVQEYIKSPALMDNHKFDFRSYLLIASTDPFIVFYHDGFVRRASGSYSTDSESLKDPRKQVTNSEKQDSENHFFGFAELERILHETYGSKVEEFSADVMRRKFIPQAMRATNYLFHTAKVGTFNRPGLQPTPGRFQVFALDWMVDSEANFHLLEANGNPLVTHYPNTDLTPGLWTSMIRLEKLLHTAPEDLLGTEYNKLSVKDGYRFEGWKLVYNQVEVESNAMKYEPCKFNQYAEEDHPLFSYNNYAEFE